MIQFEWVFISFIIGFVTNYLLSLKYLKGLRGESKAISDITIIITSLIWGSLINLIMYIVFDEFKNEDKIHNHRFLISEIIITVVEISLVVILSLFKVITYPSLT